MCSVYDESDGTAEFVPDPKFELPNDVPCQKCNSARATVLLRGKDVYCDSCFVVGATHKFRATLGKSKLVRPTDNILVVHTGNAGSTALLHLIRAGMELSVPKRLLFRTKVIYIDDGAASRETMADREKRALQIETQIKHLGFECYGVSLNRSYDEGNEVIEKLEKFARSLTESSSKDEKLKNIFDKLSDYTSKVELLRKLRRRLMYSSARKLECSKIFVADDSTSLAIDILTNVALGRGAQLFLDAGFVDTRHADVTLLRPMRDFTQHELDCYLTINNLKTIDSDYLEGFANEHRTIQSLTEKFVTDLDLRSNGTVSTVFRTGEKISAASSGIDGYSDETCVLCDAPSDTVSSETTLSAMHSTCFSTFVSSQRDIADMKPETIEKFTNSFGRTDEGTKDPRKSTETSANENCNQIIPTSENVTRFLCYGCTLIFKNSNTNDIPDYALNRVIQRLRLKNPRDDIKEFIL